MKNDDRRIVTALTWMYHVLFLVTPFLFTWVNDELFEFNKMLFVYGVSAVIGGLWVVRMLWQKKFSWQRTIFDVPLALFLFSQLLSTLFSIHMHTSIFGYYSRFHGGLLSSISYAVLFAAYVQNFSSRDVMKFLQTLAVGCAIVAAWAIPEHFGHSFSCVLINSSQLTETAPLSAVLAPSQLWESYNATCWIQDVQHRVFATFGQPNWLAAYVITLLPLFMAAATTAKSRWRWVYGVVSVCAFLTLLFTRSRSGILGWGVGLGWMYLLLSLWFWRKDPRHSIQLLFQDATTFFAPLASVTILLVLCAALFGTPYTPSISDVFSREPVVVPTAEIAAPVNRLEEGGTDSGQIRVIVWKGALNVWKRYPLFGSGVETFAYSYYQDRPMEHNFVSEWDFLYNKAHNEFLNFLATTGLVGLTAYVVMLTTFISFPVWIVFRQKNISSRSALLLAAISSGLVSLTISNAFGFSTVMVAVLFFILPAMSWHLAQEKRSEESAEETADDSVEKELEVQQMIWSTLVAGVVVILLVLVWRAWQADYSFALGKNMNQQERYDLGISALEEAYALGNGEGVFTEELAEVYSWISSGFADAGQATSAALFREASLQKVDEMMLENPYNLNFYKTKARALATLSPQDPSILAEAELTLEKATQLAPTDPRVRYNLGLVKLSRNATPAAQLDVERAVEMRPAFEDARMTLAKMYVSQDLLEKALAQYRYIIEQIQPKNEVARAEIQRIEAEIASASAKTKTGTKK